MDTIFGGQAFMLDGGTIEQPVKLKPNDDDSPHTYMLSAVVRFPYSLSVPVEISELVDHPLTLRVTVADQDGYIKGLRIDSACIDPSGDGNFPGQNPGGGYQPPFVPKCGKPPNPLNEMSVGAWTY